MNEILAGIYGTGGFDKTASVSGEGEMTLSDLALMLTVEQHDEGTDLEKVASVHNEVLDNLVAFDRAGRAMAHSEFSEIEKAAHEGNMEPLEAFFADVAEDDEDVERQALRQAIEVELSRRHA